MKTTGKYFKINFSIKKLILTGLGYAALSGNIQNLSAQTGTVVYPRITGHVGIVHPLFTISSNDTHTNFDGSYTVGMPVGINIWKSPRIGFSMEIVPFVKAENGSSKMSNTLIHPGILVALGNGFK